MGNKKNEYPKMCVEGTLWAHLHEIDEIAQKCEDSLIESLAKKNEATEKIKLANQLEWI